MSHVVFEAHSRAWNIYSPIFSVDLACPFFVIIVHSKCAMTVPAVSDFADNGNKFGIGSIQVEQDPEKISVDVQPKFNHVSMSFIRTPS